MEPLQAVVIDAHCHAGKGDGLTGPWDTAAPLDRYVTWARESGVDKTVLFAAFHSDYLIANRAVAAIVRTDPARFYGYAFVHPQRDAGRVERMVEEAVTTDGFCGIKVHRHDGRMTREVCETARRFQIPILYDVMGEVPTVGLLAQEYPDVNFVVPHLGSFGDDWRAQYAMIDHLEHHPNVFTDTSGVRRFDLLEQAVQRAGPSKVLYGSDGPWLHPGVELEKVRALRLSPGEYRQVVGGNFLRLTRNVRRGFAGRGTSSRGAPLVRRPRRVLNAAEEVQDPWISEQFRVAF